MDLMTPAMTPNLSSEPTVRPRTGPKTTEGLEAVRGNAVQHGLSGAGIALPEALANRVAYFRDELCQSFPPRLAEERRWIEDAALGRARRESAVAAQASHVEDRATRASADWNAFRQAEVEELAGRLMGRPSVTVARLLGSRLGLVWLRARWTDLSRALAGSGDWDSAQRRLARRLMGIDRRFDDVAESPDWDASPEARRAHVAAQIDDLNGRIDRIGDDRDEARRDRVIAGLELPDDTTYRRFVRYERDANRLEQEAMAHLMARRAQRDDRDWCAGENDAYVLEQRAAFDRRQSLAINRLGEMNAEIRRQLRLNALLDDKAPAPSPTEPHESGEDEETAEVAPNPTIDPAERERIRRIREQKKAERKAQKLARKRSRSR